MVKKIIIITGKSDTGKTTILNKLKEILEDSQNVIFDSVKVKPEDPDDKDYQHEGTLHGQKIVINTMGDYAKDILKIWETYRDKNVSIFITACNSNLSIPFKILKECERGFTITHTEDGEKTIKAIIDILLS